MNDEVIVASGKRKGTEWRVRRNPWGNGYQVICTKALKDGHMQFYQSRCYSDRADAVITAVTVSDAWSIGKDAI